MSSALKNTSKSMPLPWKLAGVLLAAVLLMVGLMGLVLPLIPGLIFLALAVWILAKISTRFAAALHGNPRLSRHLGFLRSTEGLSVSERLRLGMWVTARVLVDGLQAILFRLKR